MSDALLAYSFTLGMATTVNPCGLPLLPAYLSLLSSSYSSYNDSPSIAGSVQSDLSTQPPLTDDLPSERSGCPTITSITPLQTAWRAIVTGFLVSIGFLAVFGTLGILLESGFTVFMKFVPWVMIPLAIVMVLFGIYTVSGRRLGISIPALSWRNPTNSHISWSSMVLFGVSYALASLTCSLPIFIAGIIPFHANRSILELSGNMGAFLLGMAALLIILSVATAMTQTSLVRVIKYASRYVERFAALILVVVGAYLVDYWINDLVSPTRTNTPIRIVESWQSALATWISAHSSQLGMIALVVAIVVIALLAIFYFTAQHKSGNENTSIKYPNGQNGDNRDPAYRLADLSRSTAQREKA